MHLLSLSLALLQEGQEVKTRRGSTLYVREQLECMELCLGIEEEPTESSLVSIKERTGKGDIILGVCYRPPDQEEQVDEVYRQIEVS